MPDFTELIADFKTKRTSLLENSISPDDPVSFSLQYASLIDHLVLKIAELYNDKIALCAVGSYGRKELSPYSDVDLMFIVPEKSKPGDLQKIISDIITPLWDSGLEVPHTVRMNSDIKEAIRNDLHTLTPFYETRFITGNRKVYASWNEALLKAITEKVRDNLFTLFIEDRDTRHDKFGNSPKMIEPNIKLSPGGLRDFQLLEWLYTTYTGKLLFSTDGEFHARKFISAIVETGIIPAVEGDHLYASYTFLILLRNKLHLRSGRKNDRLEFEDQNSIAIDLGYTGPTPYSELMKKFFDASSTIYRSLTTYVETIKRLTNSKLPKLLAIDLSKSLEIKGGFIYLKEDAELLQLTILKAFYFMGFYSAEFDAKLRNAIIAFEPGDFYVDVDSESYFKNIFRLEKNTGKVLESMNELGFLEKIIPQYKDLQGFIQHGVYHYYAADEHSLKTIVNVEKLELQNNLLGKVYRSLSQKEFLFLSLLFHDIAKPVGISGHNIVGAEMASGFMQEFAYTDEEIGLVRFLIENHLYMEQVAFRRNLNDPETLNNFAAKFPSSKHLDYLYLLTYADLSAVNPALWTSWKREMLNGLYRKTKAILDDKITGEDLLLSSPIPGDKETTELEKQKLDEHIDAMDDSAYTLHFSEEEIFRHITEIERGEPISVLFHENEFNTSVTIISMDAPYLLSRFCGVFAINDINIHDARIFTRKDGLVIDTFTVTDFKSHSVVPLERHKKVREDMESVFLGMLQIGAEIKKLKTRWKFLEPRFFRKAGQIKIRFEEHDIYTIIDVFSPDRLGFLYQLTRKMNELGLSIYFAKIATHGDDIIDAFYVLDRNKKRVSKNYYHFIESELKAVIEKML